ncbi:MAG: 2-amino-4-hydroxy-6-hydroxymethyldihydropteridine diphosphokinase, partial [Proteobacteria bacterium]|nr:2-amino-4-hydroxy-6-hydroxymethyldihydropteridine diphosphokinase [Pseudomonadota bacterium]
MPEVAVSLGANIDRESNIRAAVSGLIAFYPGALFSPVFESKAVGFEGPDFFNLAGIFYSDLEAPDLVTQLREIEAKLGRTRDGSVMGSREMDIDLLLYGDQILYAQGIDVPRHEILECAHVLKPLSLVWPDQCHPVNGLTYS